MVLSEFVCYNTDLGAAVGRELAEGDRRKAGHRRKEDRCDACQASGEHELCFQIHFFAPQTLRNLPVRLSRIQWPPLLPLYERSYDLHLWYRHDFPINFVRNYCSSSYPIAPLRLALTFRKMFVVVTVICSNGGVACVPCVALLRPFSIWVRSPHHRR